VGLAAHGSMIIVLLLGGYRVAAGAITLGELVAFLLYVTYAALPLGDLFEIAGTMQRGLAALQRVQEVTDLPVEESGAPAAGARGAAVATEARAPAQAVPALQFRDVVFGYQPDRPVLKGVSFEVPRGSHVALVGPSGAGKSTIFSLIARFYDPSHGSIRLDGHDTRSELSLEQCRARIGLVEQTTPVLYGTLRDNVCYARPDADEDEVWRAVDLSNLRDLVRRLPRGLDTDVGERGTLLSGGERQRVAIARALAQGPRVLLADEPVASLDAGLARQVMTDLVRVARDEGVPTLITLHDVALARSFCDRIVGLSDGTTVFEGRPQQLDDAALGRIYRETERIGSVA
jgi:ABC-type multidrug transport system fused ATPase/permease subunit